jgi:hypothetical protein
MSETSRQAWIDTPQQPDGSQTTPNRPTGAEPEVGNMRLQRMHDFLVQSLGRPDPLRANVGAVSVDLMSLSHMMKQAIDERLRDGNPSIEAMAKVAPALDSYLRLNRQLGRFLDLEKHLRDAEQRRPARPQ